MPVASHKNHPIDYDRAKRLRLHSTEQEQKIWLRLGSKFRQSKLKFRRQHPIHPYIVDFICLKARLIIELDGYSHDVGLDHDNQRTKYLESRGYMIMRFPNSEVDENLYGVVETILEKARELSTTASYRNPSPAKTKGLAS